MQDVSIATLAWRIVAAVLVMAAIVVAWKLVSAHRQSRLDAARHRRGYRKPRRPHYAGPDAPTTRLDLDEIYPMSEDPDPPTTYFLNPLSNSSNTRSRS